MAWYENEREYKGGPAKQLFVVYRCYSCKKLAVVVETYVYDQDQQARKPSPCCCGAK